MKRILVVTSSIDETASYIISQSPSDYFRFDVNKFSDFEISIGNGGWTIKKKRNLQYASQDKNMVLDEISETETQAIYYRKPMLPALTLYHSQYHSLIQRDIIALVNGIVDSFTGIVLSKPAILRKCENKIYQLLYAATHGFIVPQSYIGNSDDSLKEYMKQKSIIKPISTGKTHGEYGWELYQTNILMPTVAEISLTPVYLQEYIPKQYEVRMTIVGEQAFSVRIDTENKIDWRADYEHHKYTLIECPTDLKHKCMQMMRDFDIRFGAFDFIVTPENEWIFLEVNPNGQWLWLEKELEIDISGSIIGLLKA